MDSKIKIALHAQTLDDPSGRVAGSEITTLGLQRALLQHPQVDSAIRIGPGKAEIKGDIDLLLIEGYHPTLEQLIPQMRKQHPKLTIVHWCLSLLGLDKVRQYDIDAFLTNSKQMEEILQRLKPTKHLLLATDRETFSPGPPDPQYQHEVVYLGHRRYGQSPNLEAMLHEASAVANLTIYGADWETHPTLNKHHRGHLPTDDIPKLYRSAGTILATTEERQKALGMINNRIFEAAACQGRLLAEWFPELEALCGDHISYAKEPGDVAWAIKQGDVKPALHLPGHTYHDRVPTILELYEKVKR